MNHRVVEELARLLEAGVQAGSFKTGDALITATMLFTRCTDSFTIRRRASAPIDAG